MAAARQVEEFLQKVAAWAGRQPEILSLGLVGSYARGQARDASDVDLILVASDPGQLLEHRDWIEIFGSVLRVQAEDYGRITSLRAWYLDGLEVEFGLAGREWARQPLDPGTRRVIEGGLRVLFERESLLGQLLKDGIETHRQTG